jgi:hypothetical protein
MSFEMCGKVINDLEIKNVHLFAVMICLAEATNHETGTCYPSLNRISKVARCSRRTAINMMQALEQNGWVEVIRRTDKKGWPLANVYRITKYNTRSDFQTLPSDSQTPRVVHPRHHLSAPDDTRGSAPRAPKPGSIEPIKEPVREEDEPDLDKILGKFDPPKNNKARPWNQKEVEEFCKSIGLPRSDGEYFYYKWTSNGFTNGKQKIKDWKATIRSWKAGGYCPSQKNGGQPVKTKQKSLIG